MRGNDQFKNHILKGVSIEDFETYFKSIELVPLVQRNVIFEIGGPLDFVYFPEEGVGSVITIMENSSTVEAGMIGREGILGISALLGGRISVQQIIVQVPGSAWRMPTAAAQVFFNQDTSSRSVIHRFIDSFLNMSAQTAACNRLHTIEQRCARWILMVRDRVDSDTIPMTHEFLSAMLGVRRPGVTEVAAQLRSKGLIDYRRGSLHVVDHQGLIEVACECYLIDHHRLDDNVR